MSLQDPAVMVNINALKSGQERRDVTPPPHQTISVTIISTFGDFTEHAWIAFITFALPVPYGWGDIKREGEGRDKKQTDHPPIKLNHSINYANSMVRALVVAYLMFNKRCNLKSHTVVKWVVLGVRTVLLSKPKNLHKTQLPPPPPNIAGFTSVAVKTHTLSINTGTLITTIRNAGLMGEGSERIICS